MTERMGEVKRERSECMKSKRVYKSCTCWDPRVAQ